jgi:hypothetical protein
MKLDTHLPYDYDARLHKPQIKFNIRKTWSLTLKDECRLSVSENWVWRKIFGSERDEATGEWRTLIIS